MEKYNETDIAEICKLEAFVTGFKDNTIRLITKSGDTGLCTLTYSCDMTVRLQNRLAARIATLWNLHR